MISQKTLKSLFNYCHKTGVLTRKDPYMINRYGLVAGTKVKQRKNNYLVVSIEGVSYRVHRLAWLYYYGHMPKKHIDHIDGNGLNNSILNLRDVSHQENHKNKSLRSNNSSGIHGVSWLKSRKEWVSHICVNGKRKTLGYSKHKFDACCLRKSAEIKYGYHRNHGRK